MLSAQRQATENHVVMLTSTSIIAEPMVNTLGVDRGKREFPTAGWRRSQTEL
jgi:hypothetical protein